MSNAIIAYIHAMEGISDIEEIVAKPNYSEEADWDPDDEEKAFVDGNHTIRIKYPTWQIVDEMGYSRGDMKTQFLYFIGSSNDFMKWLKEKSPNIWDSVKEAEENGELEEYE